MRAGDLVFDLESHEVTKAGRAIPLTPTEFRLLHALAMNEGRVVPYSRLVGWPRLVDRSDVDVASLLQGLVESIRSTLGIVDDQQGGIIEVPGVGYSLARAEPV